MENILELQQVSKTYPKSDFVLDNVTFSLPYGAVLGFVGENGAGKTTTISCILNTIKKDSGTVKIFGREMLDSDTDMREQIIQGDGGTLYAVGSFFVSEVFRSLSFTGRTENQTLFQGNDDEVSCCRGFVAPSPITDSG